MTEMKTSRWVRFISSFVGRFTLIHVITYLIFRILFTLIIGYSGDFAAEEMRNLMRPSDSPWIIASVFFQFLRGFILAIALLPVKKALLSTRFGWARLWFLLFVLSGIGASVAGVGTIEGMVLTQIPLKYHFAGLPELAIQLLALSWLIAYWEGRIQKKDPDQSKSAKPSEKREDSQNRTG